MSHRHACDAGHYWDCFGTALRPLMGDTEPSVCMCIRHRVPMEVGDHSACSIELLACPEHREEQRRRMEEPNEAVTDGEETTTTDGCDELFRLMTPEESLRFEEENRFLKEVVYAGLENINTGFDAVGIFHFSPADFGEVIDRCEHLNVHPNGIEVFTTDGGFIECVFAMDDGSPDESFDWARRLVQKYREVPDITMSATFSVPDSALKSRGVPPAESGTSELPFFEGGK
jgi:hypothetical protein